MYAYVLHCMYMVYVCFRLATEHREAVVSDAVEEGAALCVGQQLDFLQKELERLQVCVHPSCSNLLCVPILHIVLAGTIHMLCAGGASCACIPAAC